MRRDFTSGRPVVRRGHHIDGRRCEGDDSAIFFLNFAHDL